MSRFFAPALEALAPYTPGEQPQDGAYIKLNTNENPYALPLAAVQAAQQQAQSLNLYPDPELNELRQALSEATGLPQNCLTAGNGSDELLAFCFAGLCPGGAAFPDITYGFYPVFAAMYGVQHWVVPLREDFSLAVEDYAGLGQTLFIANPNAPSGLALSRAQIEQLLAQDINRLVVLDEAYTGFGAETALPLLEKYDNLLIINTFSKSRAMAGARLGWAAGGPALIADLNRIRYSFNPYNLNRMTMAAGAAILRQAAWYEESCFKIKKTRAKTINHLRELGFTCTASLANFVFASHAAVLAQQLYQQLKERGILVRWFDKPRINNHLRITVGTDEQMDKLLQVLGELVRVTAVAPTEEEEE